MEVKQLVQTSPPHTYTVAEHRLWTQLYCSQIQAVQDVACELFKEGLDRLSLDLFHVPDMDRVSSHLCQFTGWSVAPAQNHYLSSDEYMDHLITYRCPASTFLRSEKERDFTLLPDLFHDYFGHLPFMADPCYSDIIYRYAVVYKQARTDVQREAISRLFWATVEFGFIQENGKPKVLGAALYSSRGELKHALSSSVSLVPFDMNRVVETETFTDSYHSYYFVIDSLDHLRSIIDEYGKQEGLDI